MDIENISLGNLSIRDYQQLLDAMKASYPHWPGNYWSEGAIERIIERFPEGQLVVKVNGKVVGCALSIIVRYSRFGDQHTYKEITGNYRFDTHDPLGDTLYGIEVFIHPDYRGLRLARRLYDRRKELCEQKNLKAIVFGGRIPNYHAYADRCSPRDYITKVKYKEIYDPVLSFQLSNDFHVKKLIKGYMPEDSQSLEYATLLQWDNVYYQPEKGQRTKTFIRLGLVQWQMRAYSDLDSLFKQVEYFIDAISAYQTDFAVLPELFNGPLIGSFENVNEAEAMRELAAFTPAIQTRFKELAIRYNVNIITGSMPILEGESLYNAGFLCHRDGRLDEYRKIHIAPYELRHWGMMGGNRLSVFQTDAGKVGILLGYDVEFPELSRLLADQGLQILFVPFLTDTQNAYMRVRYCSQARAIENECFVAIVGSVGNLPKVENLGIQYAQSAVFTPCDFAFPSTGIKSEATPNTEMVLIVDLDMELLDELHSYGTVQNLKDRRRDFFSLVAKTESSRS